MVSYTEHWFHRLINKLVVVSVFVIIIMLFTDLVLKIEIPYALALTIDTSVNIIFVIDLLFIFRNSDSLGEFLKKNWLDIIACIPFNELFRVAKLIRVIKLARVTKAAKLATSQAKIAKVIPKANRLNRLAYLRSTKVFSGETDFKKQMDLTRDRLFELRLRRNDRDLKDIVRSIARLNSGKWKMR